ncbi:MAG: hypothetical protein O2895_06785, partial [Chloroflexi bacterium]|nr:hypothetical protein [Chloroflexota bacterium]
MKRTFSLAALAVLAALASLALACGGGDDEADATSTAVGSETATATAGPDASEALTIESADGLAVLTVPEGAVPEGALPEGVAASALSVTQEQGPDETAFAVYRLEPDGLVPLAPLTLTVTIEPGPDEAVVLLVTDLDGALIEDATAIVDLAPRDDGRLDVVFAVQHFSDFILGRTTRTLRIDIEPLDDQPLGATFMVRARIVRDIDGFEHELVSAGIVHRWTAAGFVGWAGAGNWRATPPLRPSEAVNPGTGSGTVTTAGFAASDSAVIVEQAFTSGSAGDFSISLSVFGITSFTREGGSGLTIFSEPPPVVWSARCVPPGTATATSTPTPTPTP